MSLYFSDDFYGLSLKEESQVFALAFMKLNLTGFSVNIGKSLATAALEMISVYASEDSNIAARKLETVVLLKASTNLQEIVENNVRDLVPSTIVQAFPGTEEDFDFATT